MEGIQDFSRRQNCWSLGRDGRVDKTVRFRYLQSPHTCWDVCGTHRDLCICEDTDFLQEEFWVSQA